MDKNKETIDNIAQKRLLRTIIGKGTKFSITYQTKVRQKGFIGFFKPKVYKEVTEEFVMKEPTLAVLDRASEIWLRMDTSAIEEKGADSINEGYRLAHKHAHDMAEAIAVLVLGEKYYAVDGGDDKEIERLTELFYKTVKPSQASELALLINATSNLVDFVDSTRLMRMSITTAPTGRVE